MGYNAAEGFAVMGTDKQILLMTQYLLKAAKELLSAYSGVATEEGSFTTTANEDVIINLQYALGVVLDNIDIRQITAFQETGVSELQEKSAMMLTQLLVKVIYDISAVKQNIGSGEGDKLTVPGAAQVWFSSDWEGRRAFHVRPSSALTGALSSTVMDKNSPAYVPFDPYTTNVVDPAPIP